MDASIVDAQGSGLTPESEGLRVPAGLDLMERLGASHWVVVYKARFEGDLIVLKVYTDAAADWYRRKLDKNVAVFEMMQNRKYRRVPELLPHTAKPLRVIGQDGRYTLAFMQEFVDGLTLEELGEVEGGIPGYLIRTGENLARVCEEKQIPGIDRFMNKCRFRREGNAWVPTMFDFKHPLPNDAGKQGRSSLLSRLGVGGARAGQAPGFLGIWQREQQRYA